MARPKSVHGISPEGSIFASAELIMPVRVAELLAFEKYLVDPKNVLKLHEMRIAAKRLRYTIEIFAPHFGDAFPIILKTFKEIQDHLGFIHDADVLVPELETFMQSHINHSIKKDAPPGVHFLDLDGLAGLIEICRKSRDERDARYIQFIAHWNRLREEFFFESLITITHHRAAAERAELAVQEAELLASLLNAMPIVNQTLNQNSTPKGTGNA